MSAASNCGCAPASVSTLDELRWSREAYFAAFDSAQHNFHQAELAWNVACAVAFDWGLSLAGGPKCYWCGAERLGITDAEVRAHIEGCESRRRESNPAAG